MAFLTVAVVAAAEPAPAGRAVLGVFAEVTGFPARALPSGLAAAGVFAEVIGLAARASPAALVAVGLLAPTAALVAPAVPADSAAPFAGSSKAIRQAWDFCRVDPWGACGFDAVASRVASAGASLCPLASFSAKRAGSRGVSGHGSHGGTAARPPPGAGRAQSGVPETGRTAVQHASSYCR
ncbi:hypothetical protein AB0B28_09160 [Glycomyces sp. NPDC046736]|uniref:hypothetical protein n=1 Tax=Glycomyces sp. NPDC046736 TaxID=3155615 RepID=UPI00340C8338